MSDLPPIMWRGKQIDDLTREEAIEALKQSLAEVLRLTGTRHAQAPTIYHDDRSAGGSLYFVGSGGGAAGKVREWIVPAASATVVFKQWR